MLEHWYRNSEQSRMRQKKKKAPKDIHNAAFQQQQETYSLVHLLETLNILTELLSPRVRTLTQLSFRDGVMCLEREPPKHCSGRGPCNHRSCLTHTGRYPSDQCEVQSQKETSPPTARALVPTECRLLCLHL